MTDARFNVSEWAVDRHVTGGLGDRVALRTHGRSVTYDELADLVAAAGGALGELGVRRDERVLLVLLDGLEFVTAFLGAARIGAIPVAVNPLLPPADLGGIAAHAGAHIAVVPT